MKFKVLLILFFFTVTFQNAYTQRSVRIGYIDTEYILENVPEYQDALSLLNQNVQKWQSDIEVKNESHRIKTKRIRE
jgi:Skp family chaperone for outer membrane proteins